MDIIIENLIFQWKEFIIKLLPAIKMIRFFVGIAIIGGVGIALQYYHHKRRHTKRNYKKSP